MADNIANDGRRSTRAPRLWGGTLFAASGLVGRVLLQGVTFIVVARQLGADGYGAFVALVALFAVLLPFINFGYGAVLIRATANDPNTFHAVWGRARLFTFSIGVLAVPLIVWAVNLILFPQLPVAAIAAVAFADLVLERLNLVEYRACQAQERLDLGAAIQLRPAFLRLLLAVGLVVSTLEFNLMTWAAAYCIASLVGFYWNRIQVRKHLGSPVWNLEGMPREIAQGFPFAATAGSERMYQEMDKVFLATLLGVNAAGIYAAAFRIMELAWSPVAAFMAAGYRRFFQAGARGVNTLGAELGPGLLVLTLYSVVAGVLMVIGAPLVVLLFGESFASSVRFVQLLAPLLLLLTVRHFLSNAVAGLGKQHVRALVHVAGALLKVGALLLMIPRFGIHGVVTVAIAFEMLMSIALGLIVFVNRHERGFPSGDYQKDPV